MLAHLARRRNYILCVSTCTLPHKCEDSMLQQKQKDSLPYPIIFRVCKYSWRINLTAHGNIISCILREGENARRPFEPLVFVSVRASGAHTRAVEEYDEFLRQMANEFKQIYHTNRNTDITMELVMAAWKTATELPLSYGFSIQVYRFMFQSI